MPVTKANKNEFRHDLKTIVVGGFAVIATCVDYCCCCFAVVAAVTACYAAAFVLLLASYR